MLRRARRDLPEIVCLALYASGVYGSLLWPPVRELVSFVAEPLRRALVPHVEGVPIIARAVLAFAVFDALAYLVHRAAHANPLLWRIHRFHHSGAKLGPLTTFRFHVIEIAWRMVLQFLPLSILGTATAIPNALWLALLAFNVLAHSGRDWSLGPLGRVVVSPAYHRRHHDGEPANFAMFFVCWDVLCGTETSSTTGGDQRFERNPSRPLNTASSPCSNSSRGVTFAA